MKKIIIALLGVSISIVGIYSSSYFVIPKNSAISAETSSPKHSETSLPLPATKSILSNAPLASAMITKSNNEDTNSTLSIKMLKPALSETENYCLSFNEKNQCSIFTLETDYKNYFYDEQLNATKASPILALLSAKNFHEVMLSMHAIAESYDVPVIEQRLNHTLNNLKQQGVVVHAHPIRCGDYLCAIDLGDIAESEAKLAITILHDSDAKLGNIFTNHQRAIFSLNNNTMVAQAKFLP